MEFKLVIQFNGLKKKPKKKKKLNERDWFNQLAKRNFVINYYLQTGGCQECFLNSPWKKDLRVMTFHHRDPNGKNHTIGYFCKGGRSFDSLLKELEKCDGLCENHHRLYNNFDGD